jgi:hypothetical protein
MKDFMRQVHILPSLKKSRRYGKEFVYGKYKIHLTYYKEGDVIVTLSCWHPRMMVWGKKTAPGEDIPHLLLRAGWYELGMEKMPRTAWSGYWQELKRRLDAYPDPKVGTRYIAAATLPKWHEAADVNEGSAKAFIKSLPKNFASQASQGVWRKEGENLWVFPLNNWMRVQVTFSGIFWMARILFGHDVLRSVKGTEAQVVDFLAKEGYMPGGGLWKRERKAAGVIEGAAKAFLKRFAPQWKTLSWSHMHVWYMSTKDMKRYLRVKRQGKAFEADFFEAVYQGHGDDDLKWLGGTGPFDALDMNDAAVFGQEQATQFFSQR